MGSLFVRYHIRLWEWGFEVVANAHNEVLIMGLGGHQPTSYDESKEKVGLMFKQLGWKVTPDSLALDNRQDFPENSGDATVIEDQ